MNITYAWLEEITRKGVQYNKGLRYIRNDDERIDFGVASCRCILLYTHLPPALQIHMYIQVCKSASRNRLRWPQRRNDPGLAGLIEYHLTRR